MKKKARFVLAVISWHFFNFFFVFALLFDEQCFLENGFPLKVFTLDR